MLRGTRLLVMDLLARMKIVESGVRVRDFGTEFASGGTQICQTLI
jgi:hypothetical protein